MCEPGKKDDKQYQNSNDQNIPAAPAFEKWYFISCMQAVKLRVKAVI